MKQTNSLNSAEQERQAEVTGAVLSKADFLGSAGGADFTVSASGVREDHSSAGVWLIRCACGVRNFINRLTMKAQGFAVCEGCKSRIGYDLKVRG